MNKLCLINEQIIHEKKLENELALYKEKFNKLKNKIDVNLPEFNKSLDKEYIDRLKNNFDAKFNHHSSRNNGHMIVELIVITFHFYSRNLKNDVLISVRIKILERLIMDKLPCETFLEILEFCPISSHVALALTCKNFAKWSKKLPLAKLIHAQITYENELKTKRDVRIAKLDTEIKLCEIKIYTLTNKRIAILQKSINVVERNRTSSKFCLKYPALKNDARDRWSNDILSCGNEDVIVKQTQEFDLIEKILKEWGHTRYFPDKHIKICGGFAFFSKYSYCGNRKFIPYIEGKEWCTTCFNIGHDYKICAKSFCTLCKKHGHTSVICPLTEGKEFCRYCKELGHLINVCPLITCKKCYKKGHSERVCQK